MLSSSHIKNNYYEIQTSSKKNIYDTSFNPIMIYNRTFSPMNSINTKYINKYTSLNSPSIKKNNITKKYKIITPSKMAKNKKMNINNNTNRFKLDKNIDLNHNNENRIATGLTPKIILNKSMSTYLLNKKMDVYSIYNNDDNSFLKQKILQKLNSIYRPKLKLNNSQHQNNKSENNILSLRTEKHNYARKPFVIKLEKDININNIYNNSNIYNNNNIINLTQAHNTDIKSYSESRKKKYNFTLDNKSPELFRNFEDLEKKSTEISKRKKLKKNYSNKNYFNIIKDNNLSDIKQSLDAIRTKTIFKAKKNKIQKDKLIYTNKNSSINKIKKLFIIKKNKKNIFDEKKSLYKSPHVNKKFCEDNIPQNVLRLSLNDIKYNANASFTNKRNKSNKKFLPSISEEDDKIKVNIINLVNILEKIMNKGNINIKRDFMNKTKENKMNNNSKHDSNFKYTKKIISKNINKNKNIYEKKNINKNKVMNGNKENKNKFEIFNKFEKTKEIIDNIRFKLIEYSLKDD